MWFGQLYGMSDHISFNLANEGYNVAKYVPFGPVRDVMPYLIRRAEENTSVAGQTSRELRFIKDRKKKKKSLVSTAVEEIKESIQKNKKRLAKELQRKQRASCFVKKSTYNKLY